jgi:alcohol dehydrogenase
MIARALGARVIAIDVAADKLDFARSIGAEATLNASEHADIAASILELTRHGADVSIDALGSAETCLGSVACLAKRGKHIQIGLLLGKASRPALPMDLIVAKELEILGSHGIQAHRYPAILEMIRTGELQPERLVGRTIRLEEAASALPSMNRDSFVGITIVDLA